MLTVAPRLAISGISQRAGFNLAAPVYVRAVPSTRTCLSRGTASRYRTPVSSSDSPGKCRAARAQGLRPGAGFVKFYVRRSAREHGFPISDDADSPAPVRRAGGIRDPETASRRAKVPANETEAEASVRPPLRYFRFHGAPRGRRCTPICLLRRKLADR